MLIFGLRGRAADVVRSASGGVPAGARFLDSSEGNVVHELRRGEEAGVEAHALDRLQVGCD